MTERRTKRFWNVINKRQAGLTVILEDVHDAHNISAVLRTCDAVGIQEVYVIFTDNVRYCKVYTPQNPLGKRTSGNALKWLTIHYFNNTAECFAAVRERYDHIYCTHLSKSAKSLYQLDLTQSTALVFGSERDGISKEALALSDGNFLVPQVGLTQSLNISVACAISLYEAYRQRNNAQMYNTDQPSYSENDRQNLFNEWKERSENKEK